MIRRILRVLARRGEMPDPVDAHAPLTAQNLLSDWLPRTPAERFADDVEHWLCSQTLQPRGVLMTTYLISAGVLVLLVLVVATVVGGRQMRRVLDEFTAEPSAELVPVAVSTLPVPDADGWSSQRFSPWMAWMYCREVAADPEAYRQWMDADAKAWLGRQLTDPPPVFAELATRKPALVIEPAPRRELPAAPKRRTRRPKATVGGES